MIARNDRTYLQARSSTG